MKDQLKTIFNLRPVCIGLFLLSCFVLYGQESEDQPAFNNPIKMGVKGGLSLPSLSDNSDNIYARDFESYLSFETGVFLEYGLNGKFSLQLEVNYTVKGGERKGFQPLPAARVPSDVTLPPGTVLYADFENKSALEYLEIPILVKYTIGENWKFFGNAGPYAGFLLGATQKTSGSSGISADIPGVADILPVLPDPVSFDAETDVKDNIENFNMGIIGGIGVIKPIGKHSEVSFEVRGTYGFIPLQKDDTFGESRIGSVVFLLGYAYTL